MREEEIFELKRDSRLFKIAYGWDLDQDLIPRTTNRCRFFWRVVLSVILIWPLFYLLSIVLFGLFSIFGAVFFGARLAYKKDDPKNDMFAHFNWLPSIYGHRIWPVTIYATGVVFYGLYHAMFVIGSIYDYLAQRGNLIFWIAAAFLLVYFLRLVVALARRFENIPLWEFIVDYAKAKKEGICLVVYIERPQQEQ